MKFCPVCKYYLYLNNEGNELNRLCRVCGYKELQTGGIVLETNIQEKASESYKIIVNEFTKHDPTLPHIHTITCPNESCPTNTVGEQKDVIYIKYDNTNLRYIYICNVCDRQWKTK